MIEPTQVHEIEIAKWDALANVPATDAELMVAHSDFAALRALRHAR